MENHKLTLRSFIAGYVLSIALCAINSYLSLSFGIMEEGPTIAALFFFAVFFRSKQKITVSEMAIVATIGSAGGSLGFIANFFAAQAMIVASQGGKIYTIWQMTTFGIVTSVIGLLSVMLLRQILIIKNEALPENERLPWVGAKAVQGMIDALLIEGKSRQPIYLALTLIGATFYVLLNDEGAGWFPTAIPIALFGLSAFGAAIGIAPFLVGCSYLMSMRTCVGFLVGATILVTIAPHLEKPSSPHHYIWPGVMFLTTSGLTALVFHWRTIVQAVQSLFDFRGGTDDDPVMSGRAFITLTAVGLFVTIVCLKTQFNLALVLIITMIVVGGLILQVIATRATAQTYFNPARVMGILLMGINAVMGYSSASVNVAGSGFIAGTGAQGSTLTNDMAYGRWYRIPSRWQFWAQASTIIVCSFVVAYVFSMIQKQYPMTLEGEGGLSAPVAKMWAAASLLFDPASKKELPPFAVQSMWIAGIVGIIYTVIEKIPTIRRWFPCSIGLGLGMVLNPAYGIGFFVGGVIMWIVLARWLKINTMTLNTIAIACIVAEGLGGIMTGIFKTVGIF